MTMHTPTPTETPWSVAGERGWDVRQPNGRYIAYFGPQNPGTYPASCAMQDAANAAYACRCVNAHASLVAALKKARWWGEHNTYCDNFIAQCTCGYHEIEKQIDAALALAGEV